VGRFRTREPPLGLNMRGWRSANRFVLFHHYYEAIGVEGCRIVIIIKRLRTRK
jgi:hypothetical protein